MCSFYKVTSREVFAYWNIYKNGKYCYLSWLLDSELSGERIFSSEIMIEINFNNLDMF